MPAQKIAGDRYNVRLCVGDPGDKRRVIACGTSRETTRVNVRHLEYADVPQLLRAPRAPGPDGIQAVSGDRDSVVVVPQGEDAGDNDADEDNPDCSQG